MPESYLIKNATCVLPHATHTMSVLLADGKIHLDPPATATADHTIDATGLTHFSWASTIGATIASCTRLLSPRSS